MQPRVRLHEGIIDVAPDGPFDAATCSLTLHFLGADERLRTAREIRRRLKPGAPFVAAHSSFPQGKDERAIWLSRYAAFAVASGVDPNSVEPMRAKIEAHLSSADAGAGRSDPARGRIFGCQFVLWCVHLARLGGVCVTHARADIRIAIACDQNGKRAFSFTCFITKKVRVCLTPGRAMSFSPCSLLKSAMSRTRIFKR